jgi:hypothetical protein
MNTAITAEALDVEAFALRVAQLSAEHDARSEEEGKMRSATAIRSWGERVPAVLTPIRSLPVFINQHRAAWLRDCESAVRVADWRSFTDGRSFHLLDFADLGKLPKHFHGFTTGCQLHELARQMIAARRPAAAAALNVEAIANAALASLFSTRSDEQLVGLGRAAVLAKSLHEYGHHVVAAARGDRIPAGQTLKATLELLNSATKGFSEDKHDAAWIRGYAHLLTRTARLPHHEMRVGEFRDDLASTGLGSAGDFLEALHPELVRFTNDDALVDVLRTPAPAGFDELYNQRHARRVALREGRTTDGSTP